MIKVRVIQLHGRFFPQQQKSFLFIKYWSFFKTEVDHFDVILYEIVHFDEKDKAIEFAIEKLATHKADKEESNAVVLWESD